MPNPQDPIHEQLAEARRAQILDAAVRVFAEKGFQRATTHEIAREAGVSEGTIYYYFDSKDALMLGVTARLASAVTPELFLAEPVDDVREHYAVLFRRRQEFARENKDMLHALLCELLANRELRDRYRDDVAEPFLSQLEEQVKARIDQEQFRDVDARLAARLIAALFVGLLGLYILGDSILKSEWDDPDRTLSDVVTSFLLEGVGSTGMRNGKGVRT